VADNTQIGNTPGTADFVVASEELADGSKLQSVELYTEAAGVKTKLPAPLTDAQLRASAVPVSGPATDAQLRATPLPVSGTLAVSGTLTDAELRAVPVPVSGPQTDAEARATPLPVSGPATDAQLRATPVPISGTVAVSGTLPVSGPATDVELRATPLPVSGPVTDAQLRASAVPVSQAPVPLTAAAPGVASVGVGDAEAVPANAARKGLVLVNLSDNTISLGFGQTAVLGAGITLLAQGGQFTMTRETLTLASIRAIASGAASPLAFQEFA
jgi:hypothetical protein